MEIAEYVTVERAQELVMGCVRAGGVVRVSLAQGLNRVLAEEIRCDIDYPPFDKVMMDGFAVRASDTDSDGEPAALRIVGQRAAGEASTVAVGPGEAVQINTGAPVPPGADAVVRVEDTVRSADDTIVHVNVGVSTGTHIERRARHVRAGAVVLEPGIRIGPGHIAVAAAAGAAEVAVYRQPRVSILVTGDELVGVADSPGEAQIRNSNGPMLEAMVRRCHAVAVSLGTVGDDKNSLTEAIRRGLETDFLCISGGVSMGAFDFVPDVLAACGVRIVVRKLAMKPGKPTLFGVTESGVCVFALAGNPIGAFVGFLLLTQPALEAREGRPDRLPQAIAVRLVGECKAGGPRQSYWPARISRDAEHRLTAERLSWHGSSDPFGFSQANGLLVLPADSPGVSEGATVQVLPLESF